MALLVGNQLLWPGGTALFFPLPFFDFVGRGRCIDSCLPSASSSWLHGPTRLSSAEYQPVRDMASFIFLRFLAFRRPQQTRLYQLASAFFYARSWRFLWLLPRIMITIYQRHFGLAAESLQRDRHEKNMAIRSLYGSHFVLDPLLRDHMCR